MPPGRTGTRARPAPQVKNVMDSPPPQMRTRSPPYKIKTHRRLSIPSPPMACLGLAWTAE
uniref:Uncharacterized protein n=1 Tax=Mustela putorius furo TaxID=9669 RepID=M3XVB4_MUSPF